MKQKVMTGSRQRQWSQENCSLGIPKTTLRFNESLKRLSELSETVTLTAIVYYSKQIQIIISDRVRHIGRVQESSRHELPVVLSQWGRLDSVYFSQ